MVAGAAMVPMPVRSPVGSGGYHSPLPTPLPYSSFTSSINFLNESFASPNSIDVLSW